MHGAFVFLCALQLWLALAPALAAGETEAVNLADANAQSLAVIGLDEMMTNGRPPDFYTLVLGAGSKVCDALDRAMKKRHRVSGGPYTDSPRDLLLGNQYSIRWDPLEDYLKHSAWRAEIDLDNDGQIDTIYRLTSVLGGPYLYTLALTHRHPADETVISRERMDEILGAPLQEAKWHGIPSNSLYITGPKYVDGTSETFTTVVPALPADVALPLSPILDVVLVDGRYYVVLGPAYYLKDPPIRLFIFETHSVREHSLVCSFESNFLLRNP